jgi:RHS repeat-associated protein
MTARALALGAMRCTGKTASVLVAAIAAVGVVAACNPGDFRGSGDEHGHEARAGKPRLDIRELDERDTFIVTDLLGSVLAETTTVGAKTAVFATYPFGATRYDTSHATWKYARTPRDGAVGLDHMGARFYAPELGLWTSPDPLGITNPARLLTADFAAANPYAYASQTPLIAADRDGHFPHIIVGAAVGALIGGGVELVHQLLEHGRIESVGRIGAAAAGGGVSGAITAAAPGVAMAGVAGAAGGITRRLIESHGKSAGTLREIASDAVTSLITAGASKGAGALVKAAAPKAAPGAGALGRVVQGAGIGDSGGAAKTQTLSASAIRFSQSSVNHVGEIADSMAARGWAGAPIDVVRMGQRFVTVDNTRLLAAHMTNTPVQALIHGAGEALPDAMAGRFGSATTWGDAVVNRIAGQNAAYRSLFPEGSWAVGVGKP